MQNISEIFRILDEDVQNQRPRYISEHKACVRELQTNGGVSFFLAVEPEDEKRMVIIPLETPGAVDLKRFPACQGTRVHKERLEQVGPLVDQTCLIIHQTGNEAAIFESFAENLCERLLICSQLEMLPVVRQTLERWQHFFRKVSESGLSAEQRQGLFGELSILRTLLDRGFDPDIVSCWKGPQREDRDFLFGSAGLEVKTTLLHCPLVVTIASEDQLATLTASPLFLAVLALQPSRHDGETLLNLVEGLRHQLADWPLSLQTFNDLLIEYGFLDNHSEAYRTEKYRILETYYFRVEDDFPRIEPSSLPAGVTRVKYQLLLDNSHAFRQEEAVAIKAIRGAMANGS